MKRFSFLLNPKAHRENCFPVVRSTKYEVVSEGTSYCVQPRPTGKRTSKLYETTGREVSQRLATRPHPHHCSHDTT